MKNFNCAFDGASVAAAVTVGASNHSSSSSSIPLFASSRRVPGCRQERVPFLQRLLLVLPDDAMSARRRRRRRPFHRWTEIEIGDRQMMCEKTATIVSTIATPTCSVEQQGVWTKLHLPT